MPQESSKKVLLRLTPELAEHLHTVAAVEGRSVSDVAREAIAALVRQRRSDPQFAAMVEEHLARNERTLRQLREGDVT